MTICLELDGHWHIGRSPGCKTAPLTSSVMARHVVRCSRLVAEYVRLWLRSDHVYGRMRLMPAEQPPGRTYAADGVGYANSLYRRSQNNIVSVAKVDELMAVCDELASAQEHVRRCVTRPLRPSSPVSRGGPARSRTTRLFKTRPILYQHNVLVTRPEMCRLRQTFEIWLVGTPSAPDPSMNQ